MKTKIAAIACGIVVAANAAATLTMNGNEALVNVPTGEEALLSATIGDVGNLTGKTLVKTGGGMLVNTNRYLAAFAGDIEVREGIFWVAHGLDLGTKDGKTVVSNGASLFCMMPEYLNKDSNAKPRWHNEPIEISGHGDGVKTFGALYFSKPWGNGDYESRFAKLTLNADSTICPGFRLNISGTINMNEHSLSTTNCFPVADNGVINFSGASAGQFEPVCTIQNPGDVRIVGNAIFTSNVKNALGSSPFKTITYATRDGNTSETLVGEIHMQGLPSPGSQWESVFEEYGLNLDVSKANINSDAPVFTGDVTVNKALYVRTGATAGAYEDSNQNITSIVQNVHFKGALKGDGKLSVRNNNKWNWANNNNVPVGVSLWNNANTIDGIEVYNKGILYLCNTSVLPSGLTLKCEHAYEVSAAGDVADKLINVSKIDCNTVTNTAADRKYRGWTDFKWAKAVVAGFEKKGAGTANVWPSVFTGSVNVVAGVLKVAAPVANTGDLYTDFGYDMANVTIANAGTLDLSSGRNVIAKLNVSDKNEGKVRNGTAVVKELNVNGQKAIDASEAAVEFGTDGIVRLSGNVGKELVVLRAASITGLPKVVADKTGWYARINQAGNIQELSLKYDPGTLLIVR